MTKRLPLLCLVAAILAGAVLNTEAQSAFWVLVNGALRANRPVQFASGGAGSPSLTFSVDPTTGFYRQGAGQIGVAAGGSNAGTFTVTSWTTPATLFIGTGQDLSFVRAAAGEYTLTAVAFSALGTPANGTFAYCSDCTVTTAASCPVTQASCVCAGSGSGAFARRMNGAWYCTF